MDQRPHRSAPPRADSVISDERFERYHDYARRTASTSSSTTSPGLILRAGFLVWFRLQRTGREHARRQGRPDRRLQPPQLPRPVRDRRAAAVAPPDPVRRQGRAVREALAGLAPLPPRRLPDPPRPVRRDRDGDRAPGGRARRHRRASSPRARGSGRARSARPSAASGGWRWSPAPRCCRSPCTAPSTSAAAGGSARAR